jgi:uncharacterized membrane protein
VSSIDQTIDVEVPVRMAYDQWTQFEQFPTFMEGVESVSQVDDAHLHWVADIGGVRREWDAEIVEQIPDRIVAWRATDGTQNGGTVTFDSVEPGVCRVSLHLDFDPEGLLETIGDKAGFVSRRAAGDLERFKDVVEALPGPTGAWRGAVADGTVIRSDPSGRAR